MKFFADTLLNFRWQNYQILGFYKNNKQNEFKKN